ncbi:MAG TPA: twin-arginine translocase TatA/TatE family subunit [Hyphomicrobium sp.]|nr:twin-arginine translocase TatA/TatE family subunit [Hyphomicrobium sp.]
MGLSFTHVLLFLAVAVLVLSTGKLSDVMGDFAKGIRNFKAGLAENDSEPVRVPAQKAVEVPAITDRRNA